ncbi:MAG: hypothetical protein GY757_49415, partial [bacterium]|nr:hypothetical protein [bacterium]
MDTIAIISVIWVPAAVSIMIFGFRMLFKNITYAWNDFCNIQCHAAALKKGVIENNFAVYNGKKHNLSEFKSNVSFFPYNLFLNILKMFPLEKRYRTSQYLNLALFFSVLTVVFFIQVELLTGQGIEIKAAAVFALLFTLLLGSRAKFMLLVSLGYTDILNHLLIVSNILLAVFLYHSPGHLAIVAGMGICLGLAFRNRFWDTLTIIISTLVYLFILKIGWPGYGVFLFCFILPSLSKLYKELFHQEVKFLVFRDLFRQAAPLFGKKNEEAGSRAQSGKKSLYRFFLDRMKLNLKMNFSLSAEGSIWSSLGIFLLVFSISLYYLVSRQLLCSVFIFFVVFFLLHIILLFPLVAYDIKGNVARGYMGGKESYLLFYILTIVNGVSFAHMWQGEDYLYGSIYIIAALFYLVHQLYRILNYSFNEVIKEYGIAAHPKAPNKHDIELADYIRKAKKPLTIMGHYLIMGEAFEFYKLVGEDVRGLDVRVLIDDED